MTTFLASLVLAVSWSSPLPSPGGKGPLALPGSRILLNWHGKGNGARLACYATDDLGKTWKDIGTIAEDAEKRTDLGDGNLVRDPKGRLYAVYRRNHYFSEAKDYAIEVAESGDGGVTWKPHSVVATAKRGLWAPFLLLTKSGELHCYYDDEDTPAQNGLPGHQWITKRVYLRHEKRWGNPLTVAREKDPKLLSRDGMACVVETAPGQLLCVIEGVQTKPPHSGVLRSVISRDGGKSWTDRRLIYAPKDPRFHAFSPWLVKSNNTLLLAFSTNEDRETSPPSGTPAHQMMLDIKTLTSKDQGTTWSKPEVLYGGTHRNYLPSMVTLPDGRIFATWIDFDRSCLTSVGKP